ncbi:3-oxoacyl-[acyl-carrier-protein] reductase FabG [Streptococcus sanguinis]|uniref:3-oxoacyl-[acyl-carrier-protein] reductase FabG n=1 Tax=Streptococcus sanguinis TaxID=1305 RepID=A0AB74DNZ4_STRSA|nr:SDR family oxidoreductase [Streptococcus sanguinis]RSI12879.1 3-oxoacyl-[acyl-carrier-protein] reductase FabG [Streptococcus sanguinis]RSI51780.1 3-oxoacyl-[acyl-carrier-protein] reductase FabG [Streptococcus sanguinis]
MKSILVTGSSGDIGKQLCKELLKDIGINVIGIDKEESALNDERYHHIQLDLNNLEEIDRLNLRSYNIYAFIHVAGLYYSRPLEEYNLESINTVINVNVLSLIMIARKLLTDSKQSILKNIIIVSSTAGKIGSRDPIYSLSKAALDGAMKSINKSFEGCRTNIVSPGLIDTQMSRRNQSEERRRYHIQNTLAKRCGMVEDVTNLIVFLLSDKSSYIWNQNIYINGGMT